MTEKTIFIERAPGRPVREALFWMREDGAEAPFAYVKRVGSRWWLGGMPNCCGYFQTRNEAIAAAA